MDLYSETILDHYHHPRHQGRLSRASKTVQEQNSTCGDAITLDILCERKKITNIAFESHGCAISTAAMSLLAEEAKGLTLSRVGKMTPEDIYELLGVPISPARVTCALLGFVALTRAVRECVSRSEMK